MNATMRAIFDWVAKSDYEHAEPGLILEHYTEEFNGETGLGGMEIWLPVKT
jgi:predicted transcriptional regulator YdeE